MLFRQALPLLLVSLANAERNYNSRSFQRSSCSSSSTGTSSPSWGLGGSSGTNTPTFFGFRSQQDAQRSVHKAETTTQAPLNADRWISSTSTSSENALRSSPSSELPISIRYSGGAKDAVCVQFPSSETYATPVASRRLTASLKTKSRKSSGSTPHTKDEDGDSADTMSTSSDSTASFDTTSSSNDQDFEMILDNVGKVFVPTNVWERLTGREFENPRAVNDLVQTGLDVTQNHDNNDWLSWTSKGDASIEDDEDDGQTGSEPKRSKKDTALANGEIFVYLGKCKKKNIQGASSGGDSEYYGSKLPVIKTESVIPMSPEEMKELLMDSSRVKTYNKVSLGRTDLKTLFDEKKETNCNHESLPPVGSITKIVRNITAPPITSKKMMITTMLHSRPLEDGSGSFIVVSRAVPPPADCENGDNENPDEYGKSEILLGVNLLEPFGDDGSSSKVTSVTHVYSPALPNVLASRVGVNSAINFVKDLRALCAK